ncbi:hypothetical protein P7K49_011303 [Saguinus oedipus]|uniref:Vitelline membrane outer layer protein 1 homolog n=1 Tax=Saguinus oedipus TaxID=9490 RepID=A0ABQ9VQ92_SAGOE|nr:hypothetical protein P7K49_011303 [Saguinus oedipus]
MELGARAKLLLLRLLRSTRYTCAQTDGRNSYRPVIQVEPPQGHGDDTALNGIRLHCALRNALGNAHATESKSGRWGTGAKDPRDNEVIGLLVNGGARKASTSPFPLQVGEWSEPSWCPGSSFLVAFSLRVEPPIGKGDDTAVNNVRFRCSDGKELEGPGLSWGDFGDWSPPCPKGVCGLQTKIEGPLGSGDD